METLISRMKGILLVPVAPGKNSTRSSSKPGELWGKYIIPLAALGAIARAVGMVLFGKPIAFTSLTNAVSVTTAAVGGIVAFVVSLLSIFALSKVASLLAPGFGGQKNDVQASRS